MNKNIKLIWLIGLVFQLLWVILEYGYVISFIGAILFLIAYYLLSKEYQESKIFSNALWAFLITFIGGISVIILLFIIFIVIFVSKSVTTASIFHDIESEVFSHIHEYIFENFWIIVALLSIFWIIYCILSIISFKKWRDADYIIAEKSGESLFRTAGKLLYIGSWLLVFLLVHLWFLLEIL